MTSRLSSQEVEKEHWQMHTMAVQALFETALCICILGFQQAAPTVQRKAVRLSIGYVALSLVCLEG